LIIGRLIPAGTGFNSYTEISKINRNERKQSDGYYFENNKQDNEIVKFTIDENNDYLQDDLKIQ